MHFVWLISKKREISIRIRYIQKTIVLTKDLEISPRVTTIDFMIRVQIYWRWLSDFIRLRYSNVIYENLWIIDTEKILILFMIHQKSNVIDTLIHTIFLISLYTWYIPEKCYPFFNSANFNKKHILYILGNIFYLPQFQDGVSETKDLK